VVGEAQEGEMIRVILIAMLISIPAWGEEVLYCTETDFMSERVARKGKRATFIVKVISETERTITNLTGDTKGKALRYKCRRPFATNSSSDNEVGRAASGRIVCGSGSGKAPWVFHDGTFARTSLAEPDAGDPNIGIAYGTCVKN
jgi:hypothetical protein